jgi:hypothetical protein
VVDSGGMPGREGGQEPSAGAWQVRGIALILLVIALFTLWRWCHVAYLR